MKKYKVVYATKGLVESRRMTQAAARAEILAGIEKATVDVTKLPNTVISFNNVMDEWGTVVYASLTCRIGGHARNAHGRVEYFTDYGFSIEVFVN